VPESRGSLEVGSAKPNPVYLLIRWVFHVEKEAKRIKKGRKLKELL
jgi:hypothetical protein